MKIIAELDLIFTKDVGIDSYLDQYGVVIVKCVNNAWLQSGGWLQATNQPIPILTTTVNQSLSLQSRNPFPWQNANTKTMEPSPKLKQRRIELWIFLRKSWYCSSKVPKKITSLSCEAVQDTPHSRILIYNFHVRDNFLYSQKLGQVQVHVLLLFFWWWWRRCFYALWEFFLKNIIEAICHLETAVVGQEARSTARRFMSKWMISLKEGLSGDSGQVLIERRNRLFEITFFIRKTPIEFCFISFTLQSPYRRQALRLFIHLLRVST